LREGVRTAEGGLNGQFARGFRVVWGGMSNKPLLVLPPRYTEDSIALIGAANRAGWDVDVGRLADGRWAVIEANSAWGAGL